MKTTISLLAALLFMGGQAFAEESVCDGDVGAAYGLCHAYCEALKCHTEDHKASPKACAKIRAKYVRLRGLHPPLPCEDPPVTYSCPCYTEDRLVDEFSDAGGDYCQFLEAYGAFEYYVYGTHVDHTAGVFHDYSERQNECWFGTDEQKNVQDITFDQAADCAYIIHDAYYVYQICQDLTP